jgi:hypothetical protein
VTDQDELWPRPDSPVLDIFGPPEGETTEDLVRLIEAELIPTFRVPPVRDENEEAEEGPEWVLRADIEAARRGQPLSPPPVRDDRLRRVYVIELEGCDLGRHGNGRTCVYVGQSVRSPRERFVQHLVGYNAGRKHVTKWGTKLRPDLYSDVPSRLRSQDVEEAERNLARRLAGAYNIHPRSLVAT